jgi:hypothetical protein
MLQVETYELPAVVVKLPFGGGGGDGSAAREILGRAEKLLAATPSTFFAIAMDVMKQSGRVPDGGGDGGCDDSGGGGGGGGGGGSAGGGAAAAASPRPVHNVLTNRTMPIRGHEVARWLLNEQSSSPENHKGVRFFFLDVRDADEYYFQGHFAMSFHVDPVLLQDKHLAILRNSVAGFKDMTRENFCLCILGGVKAGRSDSNSIKLAALLCQWDFNRIGLSCFDDIYAELEGKPEAASVVLRSSGEDATCAQAVLAELLSQVENPNPSITTAGELSLEGEPPAPSAPPNSTSLLLAKSFAEKGASALVGGISDLLNRVAPRPILLSPSSWKPGMKLRLEEMHQDGFVPFQVRWVGPLKDTLPKEQRMIITPSFLVFVDAADDVSRDQSHQDPSADTSCRVINKYSLASLKKISSRKKEPRMLIITFSGQASSGEVFKIGFLTRDQDQNKFAIGLIKTHFIRITQVEK